MRNLKDHYDRISPWYEILDWGFERFRYRKLRPLVWAHAEGKILDLGTGTGLNIPYYPSKADVVGVDLSEGMLNKARARASALGIQMQLLQMDATRLKFNNSAFNSVVSTFLFCVLPNESQPQAINEVHRVLVPGGRFILMEYVYSKNFRRRLWMKLLAPLVRRVYRAGFDRRTLDFLLDGKWDILTNSFIYQDTIRLIVARKR